LETQLIASKREKPRHDFSAEIATAQKQQKALSNDNTRLRNENEELHRQIRQLQITLDKAGAPSGWSR
jgi:predicted  nucleic acid-binding Zn-ribbon protein